MFGEVDDVVISRVISLKQRLRYLICGQRRKPGKMDQSIWEVLETLGGVDLFMHSRKVQVRAENGGTGGEEIENRYAEVTRHRKSGTAEVVEDDSPRLGGIREAVEVIGEIGREEAEEFESNGGAAASGGGVDRAVREGVEGNGGVGLGDGVDVGGDGRRIERTVGE